MLSLKRDKMSGTDRSAASYSVTLRLRNGANVREKDGGIRTGDKFACVCGRTPP